MYKAILVDDEKIVRLALKTIVDWTALGYTVTGSYSSVKTALLEICLLYTSPSPRDS